VIFEAKEPSPESKLSQVAVAQSEIISPKEIERPESPDNNIYGTKDYYDYYTRLQPQLRNPKLPKPTYNDGEPAREADQISQKPPSRVDSASQMPFPFVSPQVLQQPGSQMGHLGLISSQSQNQLTGGVIDPMLTSEQQLMRQMVQKQFKALSPSQDSHHQFRPSSRSSVDKPPMTSSPDQ